MQVVYLIYDSLMNSVFDSQVLTFLEFLLRQRRQVQLISFERRTNTMDLERKRAIVADRLGRDVLLIERPPFVGRGFLRSLARRLAEALKAAFEVTEPLILHSRGQIAAYIAIKAKCFLPHRNVKVLADIRGVPEEILCLTNPWRWFLDQIRYREAKRIEREVYVLTDGLCCVSEALKNWIVSKFNVHHDRIPVVHCAVNNTLFRFDKGTRERIRRELGLTNELVFVFSGSLTPWQAPERVLRFFAMVKSIHPKSHFLILTKDTVVAERLLRKYAKHETSVTYLSVDYSRVPDYLMAADIGLLLREDTLVNKVAFPTKYAEYLSCGLYVLTTKAIADIAAYTIAEPVTGYVFQQFPKLDNVELRELMMRLHTEGVLTDASRQARSAIAAKLFGAETIFSKYLEIYDGLAKS